jgi:hypothetical protein
MNFVFMTRRQTSQKPAIKPIQVPINSTVPAPILGGASRAVGETTPRSTTLPVADCMKDSISVKRLWQHPLRDRGP